MAKVFKAIGLMSGTSLDGIDLAFIESDGQNYIKILGDDYINYQPITRDKIRKLLFEKNDIGFVKEVENDITLLHADLVNNFLKKNNITAWKVDLIGFHGQTIFHQPKNSLTWQIGNPQLLALKTHIKTIADFRTRDILEGGEGAPLVPIYHFHLFAKIAKPTIIMNIGGVANITYFDDDLDSLTAFDLCFGNAPFNDLMLKKFNKEFDDGGQLASQGNVDFELINQALKSEIFNRPIPRSFSRNDFDDALKIFEDLPPQDILANYSQIFAEILAKTIQNDLPKKPQQILICGGGVKNLNLLKIIQNKIPEIKVASTQEYGFKTQSIEAQAFAFLAIRRALNFPISFPKTTNTKNQSGSIGGVIFEA